MSSSWEGQVSRPPTLTTPGRAACFHIALLAQRPPPPTSLINLCLNGAAVGREAAVSTWNNHLDLNLSCFPSLTTNNVTSQPAGQELKWVYNLPSNQSLSLSQPPKFSLLSFSMQETASETPSGARSLLISLMNILCLLSKKVEICIIPNHAGLHNENK